MSSSSRNCQGKPSSGRVMGTGAGRGEPRGSRKASSALELGMEGGGFPHSHLHPAPLTTAGIITRMITAFEFSLQPNIKVGTLHI